MVKQFYSFSLRGVVIYRWGGFWALVGTLHVTVLSRHYRITKLFNCSTLLILRRKNRDPEAILRQQESY
jgi:hypothetical protein